MKIYKSKLGTAIVMVYLLLLIVSVRFLFENYVQNKFAGLYLVALTFPWSIIISSALELLGIIEAITIKSKSILLIIGAVPNAIFLYYIWAKIEMSFKKRRT